jgi:hypothetical protein
MPDSRFSDPLGEGIHMTDDTRFQSKRSRTILGLVVVAISFVLPVAFAGVSFANSSSSSAAQYQYGKVTICHHTHSKKHPSHTIVVSQRAWKAHKKHGDTLGPCTDQKKKKHHGNSDSKGKGKGADKGHAADTSHKADDNAASGDHGKSGEHGKSGDNGNGNGKGHGK